MVDLLDLNRYGAPFSLRRASNRLSLSASGTTVYYRLYTADGPIEAYTSVYNNNDYLGRISAKSITPPHTVTSFTRCVLKVEGFTSVAKSGKLFASVSSQFPMDGATLLSVFGDSGPGLSEYEPMALVIDPPDSNQTRVSNFLVAESEMTEYIEPLDETYRELIGIEYLITSTYS